MENSKVTYEDLFEGDLFLDTKGHNLYMKIEWMYHENAVYLRNGALVHFDMEEEVIRVN